MAWAGGVKSRNRCLVAPEHHPDRYDFEYEKLIHGQGGIMSGKKERQKRQAAAKAEAKRRQVNEEVEEWKKKKP